MQGLKEIIGRNSTDDVNRHPSTHGLSSLFIYNKEVAMDYQMNYVEPGTRNAYHEAKFMLSVLFFAVAGIGMFSLIAYLCVLTF